MNLHGQKPSAAIRRAGLKPAKGGDNMSKKSVWRTVVLPLVIIPLGGLALLGALFMLYFGITRLAETLLPRDQVPIGTIRNYYALALLLIYLLLQRARLPEPLNAILMIGPVATLIIAAILRFYEVPAVAIAITALIAAATFFLLRRYKKPWIYYYAAALTVLVGVAYAWPR